jgi:hypothetical protein
MSNIGNRERRNARRCLKEESLKVKNLLDKVLDLPSEIIGILWRSAIDIKSSIWSLEKTLPKKYYIKIEI